MQTKMRRELKRHDIEEKHLNISRGAVKGKNTLKKQFLRRLTRSKFWGNTNYLLRLQSLLKSLKTNPSKVDIIGYINETEAICKLGVDTKFSTVVGVGGMLNGVCTQETAERYLHGSLIYLNALHIRYTEELAKNHLRHLYAAYLIWVALEEQEAV